MNRDDSQLPSSVHVLNTEGPGRITDGAQMTRVADALGTGFRRVTGYRLVDLTGLEMCPPTCVGEARGPCQFQPFCAEVDAALTMPEQDTLRNPQHLFHLLVILGGEQNS